MGGLLIICANFSWAETVYELPDSDSDRVIINKCLVKNEQVKLRTLPEVTFGQCTDYTSIPNRLVVECPIDKIVESDYEELTKVKSELEIDVTNTLSVCLVKELRQLKDNSSSLDAVNAKKLYEQITQYSYIGIKDKDKDSSRWLSSLTFGYQQLTGYDEFKDSTGLDQSGFIADLNVNGRWRPDYFRFDTRAIVSAEAGMKLGQTPTTIDETKSQTTPSGFNDVSDSIDGYIKILYSPGGFLVSQNGDSVLSLGGVIGFNNRDEASKGNELTRYWGVGIDFNMYDKDATKEPNQLPRGNLSIYWMRPEEYAEIKDPNVFSIHAQYQLVEKIPFLVGIKANLGPDDKDDFAVTFTFRFTGQKIIDFFSG